ncbi:VRR-NUC domain-containing protein [Pseudomonas sp. LS44]|uniref:VRR-NUC domain-containing protein n=1 Tax=Pseudomonas sp. LS44 TaxID=1357074 RepID=UPI00215AE042|nr:VRR-NUC domain-containing protein [Pseudomonas sp. LS44]UVE16406.1 VRR-NUC domain-containing protein [Pseudomonas sp. LS44]
MRPPLPTSLYYLSNFLTALDWLVERYDDLLSAEEQQFIGNFHTLPTASQALLVRLIMRKGLHFRASKLVYEEIGDSRAAAQPLLALGWISASTELPLESLAALLRKDELLGLSADPARHRSLKKADLLAVLAEQYLEPRTFATWFPTLDDQLYSLLIDELCDCLRLMFFGNLHQDWSEFVLAELGIFRYEQVPFSKDSRGFRHRQDLHGYLHLHRCRERFDAGLSCEEVLAQIGDFASDNPYLQTRHGKLLFRMAQQLEREQRLEQAVQLYDRCSYVGARQRRIRVLEKLGRLHEAHALAQQAASAPENDAEAQLLERSLQRLGRQIGVPAPPRRSVGAAGRIDLSLVSLGQCVELAVREHLSEPQAPVHYVENTLICSLFGLLCWEAIFAPLPGAFFHPFHSGPVDLLSPTFHSQRRELFDNCLQRLESATYKDAIRQTYAAKFGIQSPFVHWAIVSEELLEQALDCLPAAHLKAWFQRLLRDIKDNRAGMPDLIQFWPQERRYRMIEVKGPGDRLQDNQRRWLAFCAEHQMPVDVCYVQWQVESTEA